MTSWRRGVAGSSPADVASKSEVVFTMVGDSPDVEGVALGEERA
jgi:3-hydroxyisobutyrate dehydrogenase-like beta-hydroxyacid dehydrogenase